MDDRGWLGPERAWTVRSSARHPTPPGTVELVLDGPIPSDRISALCERVGAMVDDVGVTRVVCDVGTLARPDAATLDALARLQLTVRRLGARMWLRDACGELRDLIEFVGLGGVLPCSEPSALETRRQTEQREQALGVEEEADPRDPPA